MTFFGAGPIAEAAAAQFANEIVKINTDAGELWVWDYQHNTGDTLMSKKTAKRKAPKADEGAEPTPPVTPPEGWAKTMDLRFIDGQLHQRYESPHAGENGEHWQPIEAWETDAEGESQNTSAAA